MYCLKYRRVIETENIATAMSKNGRLMRRGQCVAYGKNKTQFIKRDATGESFLNTLVNNSHSKCFYQDITLQDREQNSIKD